MVDRFGVGLRLDKIAFQHQSRAVDDVESSGPQTVELFGERNAFACPSLAASKEHESQRETPSHEFTDVGQAAKFRAQPLFLKGECVVRRIRCGVPQG